MRKEISIASMVISLVLLSSILLCTDVYLKVRDRTVSVLCLSCIKMEPRSIVEFRFQTINREGIDHLILENLSRGPVFLHFRTDACPACDEMDPIVGDIFDVEDMDKPFLSKVKRFDDVDVKLIHINLDHVDSNFMKIYRSFDVSEKGVVPMYVIVTIGRDGEEIKPCFATLYGYLGKSNPKEAKKVLIDVIKTAVNLYKMNGSGYLT